MVAMLNILRMDFSYDGDIYYIYSLVLAFVITIILLVLPIVNTAVYCCYFSRIRDEGPDVIQHWSAPFEGFDLERTKTGKLSRWILFFPVIFYVRRINFIAFALYYVNAQCVLLHLEIFSDIL